MTPSSATSGTIPVPPMLKALQRNVQELTTLVDRILKENANVRTESGVKLERRWFDLWPQVEALIHDLLQFARVGTRGKEFRPTPLNSVVDDALANLAGAIAESGASVAADPLPTLPVDAGQLTQVFQNLIGNALKFRSAAVPRIHVGVAEKDGFFEFSVRDNGMGIEPQYFERIFMVFQRLHNKADYPGTGIGLAICKKVVERHGGRIWVESRPGEGSAFYFTLPKIPGERA